MELTGMDGTQVQVTEGNYNGQHALRLRSRDALTMEHALSIFAELLTARGYGDAEMFMQGWHQAAWEARYVMPKEYRPGP